MHYYIDGYNVVFRLLKASDDLQSQREQIIQDFSIKIQTIGLDATLVFDSHLQEGESTRSHINRMEISFSAYGETADDFILEELKSGDPRHETVVTSDKHLAWRARRRGAHTESVEDFVRWLNRRYINHKRKSKIEKKLPLPLPMPVSVPLTVKKFFSPTPHNKAEECEDYYREVFEKEFKKILEKEPPPPPAPTPKKKAKLRPPKREKSVLPDMERWQQAFESPSTDEDDISF